MPDVVLERLVDLDNAEDMGRFRQIYEDNFPDYDRKPMQLFYDWRDVLRIYIARHDGQCIGFAVTCLFDNCPAAFMSYLAIDRRHQGKGIGSRLLSHVLSRLADDTSAEALIWEVEPEESQEDHPSNRRIQFYERHGAKVIAEIQNYQMPAATDHPPIPMRLMWANLGGRTPVLTHSHIRHWIEGLFDTIYVHHPELRDIALADLPGEG